MSRQRSMAEDDFQLLTIASARSLKSPRVTKSDNTEIEKIIDYAKASGRLTIKRKLNNLLTETKLGNALDIMNSTVSILIAAQFVAASYVTVFDGSYVWGIFSFIMHALFFIEYLLRLYSSKEPKNYFFSLESFVDIISNVPFFVIRVVEGNPMIDQPHSLYAQFGNVFSLFRILRLEKLNKYIETEVSKQLSNILIVISTLMLVSAGILYITEKALDTTGEVSEAEKSQTKSYDFWRYIFFIMTTISTLGYDNIFSAVVARILLVVLILISLAIIPAKSGELISILSSKSIYARSRYKSGETIPHILITGTVSDTALQNFLTELFHPDHGPMQRHAVILLPAQPKNHMELVLRNSEYSSNVFYIQGDPMKENDLRRCQTEKAKTIVIMCNKQSSDESEEDARTIIQAMFIKKYLKQHKIISSVKLCMQILRPEGKTHYYLSLNKQTRTDQVVCIEELKLSLLAKSCLCPGLVTFISNLIASSGEPQKRSELPSDWIEEYWKGKSFEIYKTFLSNKFVGKTFSSVAAHIYQSFRAILFALEIGTGENSRILPNPGDFIIPKSQRVTGYLICEDKGIAEAISNYRATPDEQTKRRSTVSNMLSSRKSAFGEKFNPSYMQEDKDGESDIESDEEGDIATKFKQENFSVPMSNEYTKMEERYHMAHSKISINDVTFKSMENNILASNHIILCGIVPNLLNFVLPLRAKYLTHYPPIVILHPQALEDKEWNQIAYFPQIYYVKGSGLSQRDLIRANIMQAKTVVVLSPNSEEVKKYEGPDEDIDKEKKTTVQSKKLTRDQEDLLDAKTIFKYKAVMKLRPNMPIVTELVNPSNLMFLLSKAEDYSIMKKFDITLTPNFASGEIYLSGFIDSLICQTYYNSSLLTVLTQIIVGNVPGVNSNNKQNESQFDAIPSNLFHFHVPKSFVGRTFENIFDYLTKEQHILPLALYRLPHSRDNRLPYVVTNPPALTVLSDKDILFILSQEEPPSSSEDWGAPFESKEENMTKEMTEVKKSDLKRATQDINANMDDVDKEFLKAKQLSKENELVMKEIQSMSFDLSRLKSEMNRLKSELGNRHIVILERVKRAINSQLVELVPQNIDNKVAYDEDELVTGSEASSIDN